MGFNHFGKLDKIANMDANVDLFGRDSDSDSESSEASTTEENAPFPGGGAANAPFPLGGAAGGFLGQVQGAIAKVSDAGSGSEREGEEEDQEEDSPPPPSQGGAQPKKTLPRPVYEGNADALWKMLEDAEDADEEPDITKVCELLDAGIDVRYQVCVPRVCVCVCVEY